MIGTTPQPGDRPAADAGLSSHLLAFFGSFAGYFRARLELAGIEGKEASAIYVKVVFLLVLAAAFLAFGYAFLWIGLIAILAKIFPLSWGWFVLGAGVLHLIGALGCAWGMKHFWKKPVFTDTLDEFRKDQEWLSSQK